MADKPVKSDSDDDDAAPTKKRDEKGKGHVDSSSSSDDDDESGEEPDVSSDDEYRYKPFVVVDDRKWSVRMDEGDFLDDENIDSEEISRGRLKDDREDFTEGPVSDKGEAALRMAVRVMSFDQAASFARTSKDNLKYVAENFPFVDHYMGAHSTIARRRIRTFIRDVIFGSIMANLRKTGENWSFMYVVQNTIPVFAKQTRIRILDASGNAVGRPRTEYSFKTDDIKERSVTEKTTLPNGNIEERTIRPTRTKFWKDALLAACRHDADQAALFLTTWKWDSHEPLFEACSIASERNNYYILEILLGNFDIQISDRRYVGLLKEALLNRRLGSLQRLAAVLIRKHQQQNQTKQRVEALYGIITDSEERVLDTFKRIGIGRARQIHGILLGAAIYRTNGFFNRVHRASDLIARTILTKKRSRVSNNDNVALAVAVDLSDSKTAVDIIDHQRFKYTNVDRWLVAAAAKDMASVVDAALKRQKAEKRGLNQAEMKALCAAISRDNVRTVNVFFKYANESNFAVPGQDEDEAAVKAALEPYVAAMTANRPAMFNGLMAFVAQAKSVKTWVVTPEKIPDFAMRDEQTSRVLRLLSNDERVIEGAILPEVWEAYCSYLLFEQVESKSAGAPLPTVMTNFMKRAKVPVGLRALLNEKDEKLAKVVEGAARKCIKDGHASVASVKEFEKRFGPVTNTWESVVPTEGVVHRLLERKDVSPNDMTDKQIELLFATEKPAYLANVVVDPSSRSPAMQLVLDDGRLPLERIINAIPNLVYINVMWLHKPATMTLIDHLIKKNDRQRLQIVLEKLSSMRATGGMINYALARSGLDGSFADNVLFRNAAKMSQARVAASICPFITIAPPVESITKIIEAAKDKPLLTRRIVAMPNMPFLAVIRDRALNTEIEDEPAYPIVLDAALMHACRTGDDELAREVVLRGRSCLTLVGGDMHYVKAAAASGNRKVLDAIFAGVERVWEFEAPTSAIATQLNSSILLSVWWRESFEKILAGIQQNGAISDALAKPLDHLLDTHHTIFAGVSHRWILIKTLQEKQVPVFEFILKHRTARSSEAWDIVDQLVGIMPTVYVAELDSNTKEQGLAVCVSVLRQSLERALASDAKAEYGPRLTTYGSRVPIPASVVEMIFSLPDFNMQGEYERLKEQYKNNMDMLTIIERVYKRLVPADKDEQTGKRRKQFEVKVKPGAHAKCRRCGGESHYLCNGCHRAGYCSAECQHADWARHSSHCYM